jgi:fructokinase
MRNANSTWLNGRRFREDLEAGLGRPVRLANDANCLALSEAVDGAAARLSRGLRDDHRHRLRRRPGGRRQAGRGRQRRSRRMGPHSLALAEVEEVAWSGLLVRSPWLPGDLGLGFGSASRFQGPHRPGPNGRGDHRGGRGRATSRPPRLRPLFERLGRAMAVICNILDPDAFVFGGGLSNVDDALRAPAGPSSSRTCSPTVVGADRPGPMGRLLGRARRGASVGSGRVGR